MGKRNRNRKTVETVDYTNDEGDVLTLRVTDARVPDPHRSAASSIEDDWHRRGEIMFERYAVRWVVSGIEYAKQKELLARYRMADRAQQEWVQRTIEAHVDAERA